MSDKDREVIARALLPAENIVKVIGFGRKIYVFTEHRTYELRQLRWYEKLWARLKQQLSS